MRKAEATQSALNELDEKLPELERTPIYALAHAEERLRLRLRASNDVPVEETTLGPSLETMVRDEIAGATLAEAKWEAESEAAEEAMAPELIKLADLQYRAATLEKERAVAQSLVDANEAEYNRLVGELQELDRLAGHCKYGQVDFVACEHIARRRAAPSLPWHMSQNDAKAAAPRLRAEAASMTTLAESAQSAVRQQSRAVSEKRAAVRRIQIRATTSSTERESLSALWAELTMRRAQRAQRIDSPELERAKETRSALALALDNHKAALVMRNQERSQRAESLKALTACLADRLLGEAGHGRFVPDSDTRPFDLAVGGEAYQVLEVLLGDLTSLIDAATSTVGGHPGFLVHDCPREADMSERLYREFLLMASEAGGQLNGPAGVPFQYIVTTTSAPPERLQGAGTLVLALQPGDEGSLLFKRRLTTSLFDGEVAA
jgi:hypothetical protein